MPMLMMIGQRKRYMEHKDVPEQRRHTRGEAALEGRREAVVVPGICVHADTVDLVSIPLWPGKNKVEADVLAATIAEDTAEVERTVDEMAAVAAAAAAADWHTA